MRQSIQEFRALADEGDARLERMDRINAYRDEVTMKDDLPKIPEF